MSYQVGTFCYADMVAAGSAACAQFIPVRYQDGFSLHTVTCNGFDSVTGALHLDWATTSKISPTSTSHTALEQSITYAPCVEGDYWVAVEVIIGSLLALWALWYGGQKLLSLLNWSRGES